MGRPRTDENKRRALDEVREEITKKTGGSSERVHREIGEMARTWEREKRERKGR